MKALQVREHGDPTEVLDVVDVDLPEPGPGEVRIRVGAGSLNFNDIDRCRGKLVSVPVPPPYTLGMDVCGVVDAAGDGAAAWVGRRVVAITKNAIGGLAEYAIAPAVSVFDAPDGLDDAEATAFVIPFHTGALALLRRARLVAGETLLVHSGASGLGTAAIQLGRAVGARVIATVSSPAKAALCARLGAELVVDHTSEDFAEAVLEHTGDAGVDVVYDLAGGAFVGRSWTCVAREGRYLPIGFADDPRNGMTGQPLRLACIGNFSIVGVMLAWVDEVDPGMRRFGFNPFGRATAGEAHGQLLELLAAGAIRPHVGRRVALGGAAAALGDHEARRSVGRTVVEIGA
ncbi:zinc-binding dehydrogenase [Frankia sp. CNm7]|uniref:Zinc-binding dehydrogenase n=1 Tax=Frankia nepalensis TaxID=1836974 RepID=A0A937R7A1_9ACTN|nr:zinc-binding dehydrogenase [Frankia nepalensis]MBL7496608.1 zinc-binding dehydrogenase [Frankia nepalensis]MBL7513351.1 zinc-binding dehydrogenase [Frankia nepalensis]MBL7521610.1 zinc-binding dehydrogenase [Frankia nepalensis]MBL7626616.1 zinc-binding dehydrogenase [Frankia nepalensis]